MKNKKIIVIDDQHEVLDVYRSILEQQENVQEKLLDDMEDDLFGNSDDTLESSQVCIEFEECYTVDYASQGLEGVVLVEKALRTMSPYAVAFIDMRMPPGIDGMETAKRIRQMDPDIEIVIVTAYSDHSRREIVSEIGSSNNLLLLKKPFDVDEVRQFALALTEKWHINHQKMLAEIELRQYNIKLENEVENRTTELRDMVKKLKLLSTTDPMTGLYNFRKFSEQLEIELNRLQRFIEKHPHDSVALSLTIFDLDDFKKVNDNFGHPKGDVVLQTVAEVLRSSCREIDILSRYGGDEFIAILIDCNRENALSLCQRIQKNLRQSLRFSELLSNADEKTQAILCQNFDLLPHDYYPIQSSIGIAEYFYGITPEQLVSNADQALYTIKSSGKNSIGFWPLDNKG